MPLRWPSHTTKQPNEHSRARRAGARIASRLRSADDFARSHGRLKCTLPTGRPCGTERLRRAVLAVPFEIIGWQQCRRAGRQLTSPSTLFVRVEVSDLRHKQRAPEQQQIHFCPNSGSK
jgi:hypothetical protein